jgi:hypothetical protein
MKMTSTKKKSQNLKDFFFLLHVLGIPTHMKCSNWSSYAYGRPKSLSGHTRHHTCRRLPPLPSPFPHCFYRHKPIHEAEKMELFKELTKGSTWCRLPRYHIWDNRRRKELRHENRVIYPSNLSYFQFTPPDIQPKPTEKQLNIFMRSSVHVVDWIALTN